VASSTDIADEMEPAFVRLVLLPVINDTPDPALGWVEFGLMAFVAQALQVLPGIGIVPTLDTFAALRGVPTSDPLEKKLAAIESALGQVSCVWARLSGSEPRFVLDFGLATSTNQALHGTVIGADPAKLAMDAASRLRFRLAPEDHAHDSEELLNLGDTFLNQVFARAMQCSGEQRYLESEHLLDVLREAGVRDVPVLYETANVLVALGRAAAGSELQSLERAVAETRDGFLHAMCRALRGTHLELQGRIADSVAATLDAVNVAQQRGLSDLTARLMVTCAGRMAMAVDNRVDALLSQAVQRAEALGNRVVLCDAYSAASRAAGFRSDWNLALQHQLAAVTIADTMHEASRSLAYGGLSLVQVELGQLDEAARSATIAFSTSQLSGAARQRGLAAGQTALAYLSCRRLRDTAKLYQTLRRLSADDSSLAMLVARDVYCRATLLCMTGHHDEALRIVATISEIVREDPRLLARCQAHHVRVLLHARRFDELVSVCGSIRAARQGYEDQRIRATIEQALAFRSHFALRKTHAALEQLHEVVASLEASDAHARISLDAAWLHLERAEVREAAALVAPLRTWLEQSQAGVLVAGRLRYANGDWAGAVATHEMFLQRYTESATPLHHSLLEIYREAQVRDRAIDIPVLGEPVDLHWRIADDVLRELPAELGGSAETDKL
jgi:hypothetical protein